MQENPGWDDFTLVIDGKTAIEPCLQFECHTWFDDGVGAFYERARAALGDAITHYQTDSMKRTRPLDARAETIVPTWVERMRFGKRYWARFTGCGTDQGISAAMIELFFYSTPPFCKSEEAAAERRANLAKLNKDSGFVLTPFVMTLRATFPIDHSLADPRKALEWFLDMPAVSTHPFLVGHAGYALNIDHGRLQQDAMMERLGSLVLRYPGLDYYNPGGRHERVLRYDAEKNEFLPIVQRADWLTLVADPTLERLGGADAVRKQLGDDGAVTVHELPHGVAIQAGDAPQLGDVAAREFLPLYRRVAGALRPVRLESVQGMSSKFDDDDAQDWLNAFDKEYD